MRFSSRRTLQYPRPTGPGRLCACAGPGMMCACAGIGRLCACVGFGRQCACAGLGWMCACAGLGRMWGMTTSGGYSFSFKRLGKWLSLFLFSPWFFMWGKKTVLSVISCVPYGPGPTEEWIQAIRRDEGPDFCIKTGSTFVCSRHFTPEDFVSGSTISRLKSGTVPSLFAWNNFTAPAMRESAFERAKKWQCVLSQKASQAEDATADHDYTTHPPAGALDEALDYIKELEVRLQKVDLSATLFSRYCASDDQIRLRKLFQGDQLVKNMLHCCKNDHEKLRTALTVQFQLAHIFTTFCRVIQTHTHTLLHSETTAPGLPFILVLCPIKSEMSDSVKDKPVNPESPLRSDRIHVILRSMSESRAFTIRGDCTVTQLKLCLSERLRVPAEQLVLTHSGRVLRESELMSHLKEQKGSISLCMIRRPEPSFARTSSDSVSELVESELKAVPDPEPNQTPTPTSPLCSAEGLDSLGSENSRSIFLTATWSKMESQLPSDLELMHFVLPSPLVHNALCTSSPQVTGQGSLSNPQIQQLLTTNSEVEDILNNPDAIEQVCVFEVQKLTREPEMTEEVTQKEDGALENESMVQDNPANAALHVLQTNDAKMQQQDLKQTQEAMFPLFTTSYEGHQGPGGQTSPTSPPSTDSTDSLRELTASPRTGSPNAGLQSLLQEITASPGLMETLLSGPHINSVLNCLSQNPDFATQMLLSHPLLSENVQLQEHIRQHIPLFLQQMQSGELLSMMLNPRAMEALLQIQQGLQTLAIEAPSLMAEPGTSAGSGLAGSPQHPSDPNLNNQDEPLTEQQQFVHQMLKALANTSNGVRREEEEDFQEELQQLNSMGFRDRKANLQALISSGGDLSSALHLLSP
ncbi:ubiquilin-1-like [Poeciliopsis prolifica]|uniref:ubiquilin-1-like n=1 Tax=Poeciliopsis prolifica TaxID=188132 RepID=UPI002413C0E7|nr:ubiquilin-1-like [Poeciliopsis prolifica]